MWTTTVCLVLWNILTQYYVHAGIMCYNCDHLPHQRDCDTIIECGDSEMCYGEEVLSEDGLVTFRSGCKTKAQCGSVVVPVPVGKRADLIPCSKCCSTPYCNLELCDAQVTSNNKRCLSCPYALHPQDCHLSIQCNPEETCYTQTIVHNQEKRYRLGCIHKNQCAVDANMLQVVGKRQLPADYCGMCCENTNGNCNRNLCTGVNITSSVLVNPPALMFCRDNSTSFCTKAIASDPNICSLDFYKYYQCPYTCGICGPIVTNSPSLATTNAATNSPQKTTPNAVSATTPDPNVCEDYPGINCGFSIVCNVSSTAKLCKKSCNLCGVATTGLQPTTAVHTLPPPTTAVQTRPPPTTAEHTKPPPTTAVQTRPPPTTAVHTTCADPISECQCKYLDLEADLCRESEIDQKLKKFCCYYCNKKKGINRCPDTECDDLEKPEKDVVDHMGHAITCTSG